MFAVTYETAVYILAGFTVIWIPLLVLFFVWLYNRPDKKESAEDLHICVACGKDFVNPVDWEPVTPGSWWIRLRCGECEVWRDVTVVNEVAERFDIELDRRTDPIRWRANWLERERTRYEIETMIGALRAGLISPSDFNTDV